MTVKPHFSQMSECITKWLDGREGLTFVEIGVWKGANASNCLGRWGHHIKEWHLIDPYNYEDYLEDVFTNDRSADKQEAQSALAPHADKCVWVEDYSYNVVDNYQDNSIDFLYVDGNHSYEAVLQDITLYYPKVKSGGLIIFDDYSEPGVEKAALEFCSSIGKQITETSSAPGQAFIVK
jgi:hypothetical protein